MINQKFKISAKWRKTLAIYEAVSETKLSENEQQELYVYESRGAKAFTEIFGKSKPTRLDVKANFDLLNTEILDLVKYSITFDNWYFIYKTDRFFDLKMSNDILMFILKDKALTDYQISIQEILWNGFGKDCDLLERKYINDRAVYTKELHRLNQVKLNNKYWWNRIAASLKECLIRWSQKRLDNQYFKAMDVIMKRKEYTFNQCEQFTQKHYEKPPLFTERTL